MTIPSPPDPDDELLGRIARAEDTAIRFFYESFIRPVRARLLATGLSEAECEDLETDVLYEAVQKINSFDRNKGRFITWLLTIAKHRAIDFQRARGWTETEKGFQSNEVSLEGLIQKTSRQTQSKAPLGQDERAMLRHTLTRVEQGDADGEAVRLPSVRKALTALKEWLEGRSEEDRIAAEHYLYGTSWRDVAAKLSQSGKPVLENAAKQRGHRLIERAKRELAYLFPQTNPAASDTAHENNAPPTLMDGVK